MKIRAIELGRAQLGGSNSRRTEEMRMVRNRQGIWEAGRMSEIKPGDRVRCVNDEGMARQVLSDGMVYVVERVIDDCEAPIHLQLEGVDLHWCHDRFVKVEDADEAEPATPQVPSEPAAVDADRVRCTWWERHGFVYDEREQRWVLPPATERAARDADTQAAWDRFAEAAMKGLFAGDTRKTMDPDEVCRLAAECADEMLVRRAASRAAREEGGA